jgi:hypothetical protein
MSHARIKFILSNTDSEASSQKELSLITADLADINAKSESEELLILDMADAVDEKLPLIEAKIETKIEAKVKSENTVEPLENNNDIIIQISEDNFSESNLSEINSFESNGLNSNPENFNYLGNLYKLNLDAGYYLQSYLSKDDFLNLSYTSRAFNNLYRASPLGQLVMQKNVLQAGWLSQGYSSLFNNTNLPSVILPAAAFFCSFTVASSTVAYTFSSYNYTGYNHTGNNTQNNTDPLSAISLAKSTAWMAGTAFGTAFLCQLPGAISSAYVGPLYHSDNSLILKRLFPSPLGSTVGAVGTAIYILQDALQKELSTPRQSGQRSNESDTTSSSILLEFITSALPSVCATSLGAIVARGVGLFVQSKHDAYLQDIQNRRAEVKEIIDKIQLKDFSFGK